MNKMTQAEQNPFRYTDSNKRYHTYDYYLRHAFGGKVAKLTIDGGFTCPNIDGTCGTGGCLYCGGNGSGYFTAPASLSVTAQYQHQRTLAASKWKPQGYIPYFQAHTNTYAPKERLQALFEEALAQPDAVGLNIATRADCLPDDVLHYLSELSERTVLTIELGLQTVHDSTAAQINRGHSYRVFEEAFKRIRKKAPRARIGVHLIFGLPGETREMMLESVRQVAALHPDEVKLHLLYVIIGAALSDLYLSGEYKPLEREAYIELVVRALELLPPDVVLGRLTGDGAAGELLAPLWSRAKLTVLNDIDTMLFEENTWQGKYYQKQN